MKRVKIKTDFNSLCKVFFSTIIHSMRCVVANDHGAVSLARRLTAHLKERGIDGDKIDLIRHCGVDFDTWLEGFDCVENSVKDSVDLLRKHPLIPKDVKISGYVMDSVTGELSVAVS